MDDSKDTSAGKGLFSFLSDKDGAEKSGRSVSDVWEVSRKVYACMLHCGVLHLEIELYLVVYCFSHNREEGLCCKSMLFPPPLCIGY